MTIYDSRNPLQDIIQKVSNSYIVKTLIIKDSPRPEFINPKDFGHHCSYVEAGQRVWGFESHQGWLRFKREQAKYLAE